MADDGSETIAGEEGELVHAGPLVARVLEDTERTERFRPAPSAVAPWGGSRCGRAIGCAMATDYSILRGGAMR
ncbi:hypothetical protein [Novosphingobium sp. Gsoil 351]|uniref:hypothetical protein n=1 Tax=Novosphingobium sp. Gsoil 351 TaxID=2675225 RepID=UPI00351B50AB